MARHQDFTIMRLLHHFQLKTMYIWPQNSHKNSPASFVWRQGDEAKIAVVWADGVEFYRCWCVCTLTAGIITIIFFLFFSFFFLSFISGEYYSLFHALPCRGGILQAQYSQYSAVTWSNCTIYLFSFLLLFSFFSYLFCCFTDEAGNVRDNTSFSNAVENQYSAFILLLFVFNYCILKGTDVCCWVFN